MSDDSELQPSGEEQPHAPIQVSAKDIAWYFLKLGATGFGGPIALVGYMQRDLVDNFRWATKEEFLQGVAIAQTMPGPLAAQTAIWIGYIRAGILGATAAAITFILAPFLLVTAVAALYVAFSGLWLVQALFYGVGPAVIAIVAISAYRLARLTNGNDVKLWAIFGALLVITVAARAEIALLFILAGFLGVLIYAPPMLWKKAPTVLPALLPLIPLSFPVLAGPAIEVTQGLMAELLVLFFKAGALTFGSGLAVVPFLQESVVAEHHWLTERQFVDSVAMGLITPGPVVIMSTFVGYLVAGLPGAVIATVGVFLPVYLFVIVPGPLLKMYGDRPQVKAFVKGATASASGALAGAAIVIAQGAIVSIPTALTALVSLGLLLRWKVKEIHLVGGAAVAGILLTFLQL